MKRFLCSVMAVATLMPAGQSIAQQSSQSIVLHAGHVLDVKTGKLLSDQTIVIEDGKVVSVGASADAKPPADAVRIDLPNATILPGLIDAHTHLTADPRFGYEELGISVPREALIGAKNARLTLQAGFTTVRNVGADGFTDVDSARRHQCRRRARPQNARQRAGIGDYRRTLRQQPAALRISRCGRWSSRRPRRCPAQGAGEHQVRCRSHQDLRHRRRSLQRRRPAGFSSTRSKR